MQAWLTIVLERGEIKKVMKSNRDRVQDFLLKSLFISFNMNNSVLVNQILFLSENNVKGHWEIAHKKFREGETKNKVGK